MYRFLNVLIFSYCNSSNHFWVMASPHGALQSHSLGTPYSVVLLCTSDQPGTDIRIYLMMISDMLSKHVGAVKSVLKKLF